MKAVINLNLNTDTVDEAQRVIEDACRKLQVAGLINDYKFQIEMPDGPVTERCVLTDGKVIA